MHKEQQYTAPQILLGILRILLGGAMMVFGGLKFGASFEEQQIIGSAAHVLGLTFLSTTVWFWIATVGEALAGFLLVTGWKSRYGAALALIIMFFAWNFTGWNEVNLNALLVSIGALIILVAGPGAWACGKGCCKKSACCSGGVCRPKEDKDGCCGGGCHDKEEKKSDEEEVVVVE